MIGLLLVVLVVLWFLGYIHINGFAIPDITLFFLNNHPITLWDILILIVVGWALSVLPGPFRLIAGLLLILWILSVLGILAIAGYSLSSLIIIAIIIGVLLSVI